MKTICAYMAWFCFSLCLVFPLAPGHALPPKKKGGTKPPPPMQTFRSSGRVPTLRAKPTKGSVVTLTGVLRMDPVPGAKRFQGSYLMVKGKGLLLSYRPIKKYTRFIGRMVRIKGVYYSPRGQRVSGAHFRLHSMVLVPGQKLRKSKRLPTPPLVVAKRSFGKYVGRWVRVVGTISSLKLSPHESRYIMRLVVKLKDGTISTKNHYLRTSNLRQNGRGQVTVMGFIVRVPSKGLRFNLRAVCHGNKPRCFIQEP